MAKPRRRKVSPLTKILRPFRGIEAFDATEVLSKAFHEVEEPSSARLLMRARLKVLSDAADNLRPDGIKPKVSKPKKKKVEEPVVDEIEPVEEKSNLLDLNDADALLSAANSEAAVVDEVELRMSIDPAFRDIFNEMVEDTKKGIRKVIDEFDGDYEASHKKAARLADNLSYAAGQVGLAGWQNSLDSFISKTPLDEIVDKQDESFDPDLRIITQSLLELQKLGAPTEPVEMRDGVQVAELSIPGNIEDVDPAQKEGDPIVLEILSDLINETKDTLDTIIASYAGDSEDAFKKAAEQAGHLSFAAEQAGRADLKGLLDAFVGKVPLDDLVSSQDDSVEPELRAVLEALLQIQQFGTPHQAGIEATQDEAALIDEAATPETLAEETRASSSDTPLAEVIEHSAPTEEVATQADASEALDAVDELNNQPELSGLAADPVLHEIFNGMLKDATSALEEVIASYNGGAKDALAKATKQADNLAYAAQQMDMTQWKAPLDAFVAGKPLEPFVKKQIGGEHEGIEAFVRKLHEIQTLMKSDEFARPVGAPVGFEHADLSAPIPKDEERTCRAEERVKLAEEWANRRENSGTDARGSLSGFVSEKEDG